MEMPLPEISQLMQIWLEVAAKMSSAGATMPPESAPTEAAKQMRGMFFQALGAGNRAIHALAAVSSHGQAVNGQRRRLSPAIQRRDDSVATFHRRIAQADVDGLLISLRRCESRVLNKLDDLANRLEALESRLDAMETGNSQPKVESR